MYKSEGLGGIKKACCVRSLELRDSKAMFMDREHFRDFVSITNG